MLHKFLEHGLYRMWKLTILGHPFPCLYPHKPLQKNGSNSTSFFLLCRVTEFKNTLVWVRSHFQIQHERRNRSTFIFLLLLFLCECVWGYLSHCAFMGKSEEMLMHLDCFVPFQWNLGLNKLLCQVTLPMETSCCYKLSNISVSYTLSIFPNLR